jgi:hypothetical protein
MSNPKPSNFMMWIGIALMGIFLLVVLAGCSKDVPPQPATVAPAVQPVQQAAPAPVVVQAAPQSSSATDMLLGAAAGAMIANSMNSSRDRDYDRRPAFHSGPAQHQSRPIVVQKTVVHKTIIKQSKQANRPTSRPKVSLAKRR